MARLSSLKFEKLVGYPILTVAGIDEVGRGCLAGPVVAGAVVLPPEIDFGRRSWIRQISDSKLLTPEKREELAPKIEAWALAHAIGFASVEEIDRINIYHASHRAMERALAQVAGRVTIGHVLVDGNVVPKDLGLPATPVVKGDLKCLSIAAASILAKVWRDRLMKELDLRHPGYGFASHKGYSTPEHFEALKKNGPCIIHRKSFAPVALASQGSLFEPITEGDFTA